MMQLSLLLVRPSPKPSPYSESYRLNSIFQVLRTRLLSLASYQDNRCRGELRQVEDLLFAALDPAHLQSQPEYPCVRTLLWQDNSLVRSVEYQKEPSHTAVDNTRKGNGQKSKNGLKKCLPTFSNKHRHSHPT